MDLSTQLAQIGRIVESAAENIRWKIPNAFISGEQAWNVSSGKTVLACTRIRKLTISTEYTLFPATAAVPAYFSPTFGQNKDSVPFVLEWTAPEDMPLWFGLRVERDLGKWQIVFPYLFICDNGYKLLPLPNQMSDSSLCAGNHMKTLKSPSLQDLCALAVGSLRDAPWNSDLPPDLGMTAKMMRWTIDGKQLPSDPSHPWPAYCKRANNLAFDMFATGPEEPPGQEAEF